MHQSGHCRAHSMQTVQFSSFSAMTPRARVGGSSRSCGYCTVTAGFNIVLSVTPKPLTRPGSFGFFMSSHPVRRKPASARGEAESCEHGERAAASRVSRLAASEPMVMVSSSKRHLEDAGEEDVRQADRDQEFPGQRLELILAEARVREANP